MTKEQIDWSKAPEGATHGRYVQYDTPDFYRVDFGALKYWCENFETWRSCTWRKLDDEDMVARPCTPTGPQWSGEGLPPVGVVCEVNHRDLGWVRCEILAHKTFDDGSNTLAIAWIDANTLDQSCGIRFRQARTPEQIAAEEREAAVLGMLCHDALGGTRRGLAEALYDAGYRKQKGGDV